MKAMLAPKLLSRPDAPEGETAGAPEGDAAGQWARKALASSLAFTKWLMAPGATDGDTPDAKSGIVAGFGIVAVFFGLFFGWAMLASLEGAAIASGVVSVDSNRKTVQHLEGGIISAINVRDGDTVEDGQILFTMDDTQSRATLELLRGRMLSASALKARLVAERDGKAAITFPSWIIAMRGDAKTDEVMRSQDNIFRARRESLAGQRAILGQRIEQFKQEIIGIKGQIKAGNTQLDLIAEEIMAVEKLFAKGLARKPRLLELKRKAAQLEGTGSRNTAQIARIRQSIGETHLRIADTKTSMMNEVVQKLRDTQSELVDLAERLRAAEDVMERTAIRAPLAGTVVNLRVYTTGGVIGAGQPLVDIVPRDDTLVVEARINPKDIDVVHPGRTAKIRLTAFNQRTAIPLDGVVTSVSADHLTDERTGESYYLARVRISEESAEALGGGKLYPGMQAEVMIVTGRASPLEYFMRPLVRSFDRAFRED